MSLVVVNARLDIQKLIKNLLISLGTGILASFLAGDALFAYSRFNKPGFSPPFFLISIIWAIMYISIGIAAYITEINSGSGKNLYRYGSYSIDKKSILNLYYFHLIFNFLWTVIIFKFNSPIIALIDMILLFLLVILVAVGFIKLNKSTAIFMVPYLIWCFYLLILNIGLL